MARLGIFIDGAYLDFLCDGEFGRRVDLAGFTEQIRLVVEQKSPESVDILRTFYYHCLPYQGNPPTQDEAQRMARSRNFFATLDRLPRFTVRQGRLVPRGRDSSGNRVFEQKRVDLLLGLDFAMLSSKHQVSHLVLVAGDADFVPALKFARDEGVLVWLFHGPKISSKGSSTYADELWLDADERFEISEAFLKLAPRLSHRPSP